MAAHSSTKLGPESTAPLEPPELELLVPAALDAVVPDELDELELDELVVDEPELDELELDELDAIDVAAPLEELAALLALEVTPAVVEVTVDADELDAVLSLEDPLEVARPEPEVELSLDEPELPPVEVTRPLVVLAAVTLAGAEVVDPVDPPPG